MYHSYPESWKRDSNPQPTDYKSVALPIAPFQQIRSQVPVLLLARALVGTYPHERYNPNMSDFLGIGTGNYKEYINFIFCSFPTARFRTPLSSPSETHRPAPCAASSSLPIAQNPQPPQDPSSSLPGCRFQDPG